MSLTPDQRAEMFDSMRLRTARRTGLPPGVFEQMDPTQQRKHIEARTGKPTTMTQPGVIDAQIDAMIAEAKLKEAQEKFNVAKAQENTRLWSSLVRSILKHF